MRKRGGVGGWPQGFGVPISIDRRRLDSIKQHTIGCRRCRTPAAVCAPPPPARSRTLSGGRCFLLAPYDAAAKCSVVEACLSFTPF